MKEIATNKGTFLFIEVPDDAENLRCHTNFNQVSYLIDFKAFEVKLPKGKWARISTTKDITEEQAESIVEEYCDDEPIPSMMGFRNYEIYPAFSLTAKESLQSLIQANGLHVNKNYLILKQQS